MKKHRSHKYKNLVILAISIIISYCLSRYIPFHTFLQGLGSLGYVGAFFAGMLFVCSFTISIGAVILVLLSHQLSLLEIALVAGLGGVVGDYIIFHFIRDDLEDEIKPLYKKLGGNHLTKLLHTKYFRWTLPVMGAIIMVSPLPDELGVSLLDVSGMNSIEFLALSFVLNCSCMFLVALTASTAKI